MIKIIDVEQGSPEWHKLRKGLWTGSRAHLLLKGRPLPEDDTFAGNNYTKRGHALEALAIAEYERLYKTKVSRPGFVINSLYPNAGYSPDGFDGDCLLEVKALQGESEARVRRGDIPLRYLCQIYFGMVITGKKKARLILYNPVGREDDLFITELRYNRVYGANIKKILKEREASTAKKQAS